MNAYHQGLTISSLRKAIKGVGTSSPHQTLTQSCGRGSAAGVEQILCYSLLSLEPQTNWKIKECRLQAEGRNSAGSTWIFCVTMADVEKNVRIVHKGTMKLL